MPGHLDRRRAARLMLEQGIDALVLAQPESIAWAAGAFPGVAGFWRRAGAAFLVVPADADAPLAAVVGDLQAESFRTQSAIADVRSHRLWVETSSYAGGDAAAALTAFDLASGKHRQAPRPAQYDLRASLHLLRDVLRERGIGSGPIGLELGFIPAADFAVFQQLLPGARFADATRLVERLRAVKSPAEIGLLRTAAELSAAGVAALMPAIAPGMDAAAMTALWREAVAAEAARRNVRQPQSTWAYIAVGGDGFAAGGPARPGDLVKIDVGAVIDGYSSDGARTVVLGTPSAAARQVYDALHRAFDAGLALMRPGTALREVYRATARAMWDQGFETYGRGHFGHGVGASVWSEEWPFIAADAEAVLEPGMVLAFETPWYIRGLGGFIIEDQLLVTPDGHEVMAPLPRQLLSVG